MTTQKILRLPLRPRAPQLTHSARCPYSSDAPPPAPPLLLKLRGDLKTAMKAKDTSRLNVLRGILSDITNASKTATPAKTDLQIVSLLRKRAAASKQAAEEFQKAKREDLVGKEEEQVAIMEGYAGSVKMVDEEEIKAKVKNVRMEMDKEGTKVDKGSLIRKLIGPGGVFDGQPVEAKTVARMVQVELNG